LERGEGFAQFWNFSNSLGKTHPVCMPTQKIKMRKRRCAQNAFCARPQTKLRTGRELPLLYYFHTSTYFPIQTTIVKNRPGRVRIHKHSCIARLKVWNLSYM
jgi:hypothetical protein